MVHSTAILPRTRTTPERTAGKALRYALLLVAVGCQLLTLQLTWDLWQVRDAAAGEAPNLPLLPLPALPMGVPMLASLGFVLLRPKLGVILHATVYGLALVLDQYRLQPQVVSLLILMAAAACDEAQWPARMYLAAMWLWAGLHKFLSLEWYGHSAWTFLDACGLPADDWRLPFAVTVAAVETILGVVAAVRPRWGAIPCGLLHAGILLSLSPLVRDFNASVWPWNLATAVMGPWLLASNIHAPASRWWRGLLLASLFIAPAGFYAGLVNPHLAFVLYSGNMPSALHVSRSGTSRLHGWRQLAVPFPDSPRLFRQAFQTTASPGDKLHISEPRWGLHDRYYLMQEDGRLRELSRTEFLAGDPARGEVPGVEFDPEAIIWQLERAGVELRGDPHGTVVAATLSDAHDSVLLRETCRLRNLRELTIAGTPRQAGDLRHIASLVHLQLLHVEGGELADYDWEALAGLPRLEWLRLEKVTFDSRQLERLAGLRTLRVLELPNTPVDDEGVRTIAESLPHLEWIDLSHSRVTADGIAELTRLSECAWLNLSYTPANDASLAALAQLEKLETLLLEGTSLTDASLNVLRRQKQLRLLNVRGTKLSPDGIATLGRELAGCKIVH